MNMTMIIALALTGLSPDAAAARIISKDLAAKGDMVREAVRHGDLDLAKPGDVRRLDQRVRVAVRRLCGDASDADLEGKNAMRRCRAELHSRVAPTRQQLILAAREHAAGTALTAR